MNVLSNAISFTLPPFFEELLHRHKVPGDHGWIVVPSVLVELPDGSSVAVLEKELAGLGLIPGPQRCPPTLGGPVLRDVLGRPRADRHVEELSPSQDHGTAG